MNEKFAKPVDLAASTNRKIENSMEKVVVSVAEDEIVAEAAIAPIITPADLAGGPAQSPNAPPPTIPLKAPM